MIPDRVYKVCHDTDTISSEMAKDPTQAPGDVWKRLYEEYDKDSHSDKEVESHKSEITEEDLKRAYECGNWGPTRPSELFLRVRRQLSGILHIGLRALLCRCITMPFVHFHDLLLVPSLALL